VSLIEIVPDEALLRATPTKLFVGFVAVNKEVTGGESLLLQLTSVELFLK